MLDMGFLPDMRAIIGACKPVRQTAMLSATWPMAIQKLAVRALPNRNSRAPLCFGKQTLRAK